MAHETDRKLASRWGDHASLIEGGWVGVPVAFLANYGKLVQYGGLTTSEAMFVLQLMVFKWDEKRAVSQLRHSGESYGNHGQAGSPLREGT